MVGILLVHRSLHSVVSLVHGDLLKHGRVGVESHVHKEVGASKRVASSVASCDKVVTQSDLIRFRNERTDAIANHSWEVMLYLIEEKRYGSSR